MSRTTQKCYPDILFKVMGQEMRRRLVASKIDVMLRGLPTCIICEYQTFPPWGSIISGLDKLQAFFLQDLICSRWTLESNVSNFYALVELGHSIH